MDTARVKRETFEADEHMAFAITQRVMSGLHLQEVAQMTGTSLPQVEETYYHLNEAQMQRATLADYVRDKNGTIIPTM